METTGVKKQQNSDQTFIVREYESRDRPEVLMVFSEGMEEMVKDTAFRGLRHHPESLLLYLALTVAVLWISSCWWVIVLLPAALLYGRYFFSNRVIHNYLQHALNTDMADIEGFYMRSTDSCLWVAVLDGKVVGLVSALCHHESRDAVVLQRMSVGHRYRCRGVGMALGQKVLEFASTRGYSKVILGTTAYQPAAHRLYMRLGFQCTGVTNGYRSDAAGTGPSLLERVFYRVQHHHYKIQMGQNNSNDLYDKKQ